MKNLLILGAGGHGHVVAETARAMWDPEGNPVYDRIDFLDDLKPEAIGKLNEMPLLNQSLLPSPMIQGRPACLLTTRSSKSRSVSWPFSAR